MNLNFSVITGEQVANVLNEHADEVQEIIKQTYLLHHQGQTINPNSYFLRYPDKPHARIIALPAHLGGEINVSGIKWIASNPENVKKGFPRASAVLILNDGETGYPFACLESSIISATRTAASAVLAAEHFRKKNKKGVKLGIVGAGLISRYIYKTFIKNDWMVDDLFIYDTQEEYSKKFLNHVESNCHQTVNVCSSLDELLKSSDVIVFATSSLSPYIKDFSSFSHNPIVLNISLRDLSPEILINSNNVVDDIEHVLSANTSPHLTEKQYQHRDFINGNIAELINNECLIDEKKSCIFSPMGMGILDLALGNYVYNKIKLENSLSVIDGFFSDVDR